MTVTMPPSPGEVEHDLDLEQRVAELEALIKEARRRARRRRAAYAAVVLVAVAGAVAGSGGIGGGDIDALVDQGSPASATNTSRADKVPLVESRLYITAIRVDPKRPNIVYASTLTTDLDKRSMLKSTDGGKTWNAADTGLTEPASPTDSEDLRVDALALDPRSPNVLYAGTGRGVYKTTDGAKTWKPASTGIDFGGDPLGHRMYEGFIWAIAIDPRHTSTVYAATFKGVWKTSNGGVTWRNVLPGQYFNLEIDPRRPKSVYASASRGQNKATRNSIYRTVDGGGTWRATGPPGLHDNYFGHPIVIDPRSPGMIYAGGSRGLFASANQGRTWQKLLTRGVGAIALDPSLANVLYVGTSHGVFRTEDGGKTWSAPRLAGRYVTSIAIAPTRPQTIYAGVQWETGIHEWHGGIVTSTDRGATWHRLF